MKAILFISQVLAISDRYINSRGEFIELENTEGHAKFELSKQSSEKCPDTGMTHINQLNLNDNAYVGEMYVGNPPQKIRALFDTGSTNTWILNSKVDLGAEKMRSYDDKASDTAKRTSQKAHINFGSGSLSGTFMTDDIRLGSCDSKHGSIHISQMKFGDVEKQKTIFTGTNFEAIVGLAYPALAEPGVVPLFDSMMK